MTGRTAPENRTGYLRGTHAEMDDLFAAWDAAVQHIEPGTRSSRFAARLAPFPSREAAELALFQAGAVLDVQHAAPGAD